MLVANTEENELLFDIRSNTDRAYYPEVNGVPLPVEAGLRSQTLAKYVPGYGSHIFLPSGWGFRDSGFLGFIGFVLFTLSHHLL